jgi:hypothetical protein
MNSEFNKFLKDYQEAKINDKVNEISNFNDITMQRKFNQNECIFLNPNSLEDKSLKYGNNLKWQKNDIIDGTNTLIVFDRNCISQDWKEITVDKELLDKVKFRNQGLPIIIYDDVVSPLIHGQMFTLLVFSNFEEPFDYNFSNKEDLVYSMIEL